MTGADWDDAAGRWALATSAGPLSARVLIAAPGPLTEPSLPDAARPGVVRGHDVPLGALGPRPRPARRARGGDRHRRVARSSSSRRSSPTSRGCTSSSARAPWVMPHTARAIRPRERSFYRRVPAAQRAVRAGVYAGRELLVPGFTRRPALLQGRRAARRAATCATRSPTRSCAPGSRPTTRSAASGSCSPTTGIRRSREPNVELVTDAIRGGDAPARSSPPTGPSARSTRSSSAPASASPTCRSAHWIRGRGGRAAVRRLGRQPARVPRHARSPASPTCSCCSARTPASGTARWST